MTRIGTGPFRCFKRKHRGLSRCVEWFRFVSRDQHLQKSRADDRVARLIL
jgi:hypothetical protein